MKAMAKLFLTACVASALSPATSMAHTTNEGYVTSSDGHVVRSGFGLCWHTGYWTPAMATEECDPDLVKKPMPASMPKMAAAPQPAPAPAPTPIRPMPKRISLSADDLFDFNSAALKPSGMAMLDNLVRDLNGTQHDSISLTGHADRIGSLIYNQKLSERRAQSVKTYLESKGIAGKIITASGVGKTQPTAETAACKGKISKRLITCLQPDRRVDVEISGMKPQ